MTAIRLGALALAGAMCLAAALVGCRQSSAESQGSLLVESKPPGVPVLVDGAPRGKTPVEIKDLTPGKSVMVHLEDPGYKPNWRSVTVPEQGQERVFFELEPRIGFVTIESRPEGATVVLDGETTLGQTPLVECAVPVGEHTYELRLENHQPAPKKIVVEEDFRYRFLHELRPMEGRVEVISSPAGAQVWINDQLQEDRTPATFSLVPGTYTIQVHEKGYVMADASVTIGPNEEKSIRLEMMEGDAPEGMVLVPAGEFIMGFDQGAPDERPQRKVFLDAFYIDRYEVTNEEYQRVVPTHTFPKGKERFPVTGVSWEQARAYAEAVGKRLPREAEWEKAARGTDGREYPWGMRFDANLCNTADKKNLGPEEVGSYRAGASPYGCMDMAGNVQEWTADWYSAYEGNTDIQKDYGQVFRVLRGGSYLTDQYTARCARRQYDRSQSAKEDYGFRCAKDVEKGPDRTRNASLR